MAIDSQSLGNDSVGFLKAPGLTAGRFMAWLCGLILVSPVFVILWGLITADSGESWEHVQEHLLGPAVKDSLILVIGVGFLATLFGLPAAWFVSRYEFFGRKLLAVLLILPLAVPPYIAAYVTTEAREAFIPLLIYVRENYGVEMYLKVEMYHRYFWLMLMMSAVLFPYVFLAVRSVLSSNSRHFGEASKVLGVGAWRSFFKVHLPMIRPALIAGLFLVMMEVLSDYGASKHFGITTLTVSVFRVWFGLDELNTARYLSGGILMMIFLLVALERWQRGRARFSDRRAHKVKLARANKKVTLLAWVCCGFPVFIGLVYPVGTLLKWHFSLSDPTVVNFMEPLLYTVKTSGVVTLVCLCFSLLLLSVARFSRKKSERMLNNTLFTAGYASPGTVMAVGVISIAAMSRSWFPEGHFLSSWLVSGSFLWLGFALVARYLTVSGQLLGAGYEAIPIGYDQSSRVLGHGLINTFLRVHLPLLKAPVFGAIILVFVDVSKELPLTLLLRPFDFETLGTTSYGIVNQGNVFGCATPALILIGISGMGLFVAEFFGWTKSSSS